MNRVYRGWKIEPLGEMPNGQMLYKAEHLVDNLSISGRLEILKWLIDRRIDAEREDDDTNS